MELKERTNFIALPGIAIRNALVGALAYALIACSYVLLSVAIFPSVDPEYLQLPNTWISVAFSTLFVFALLYFSLRSGGSISGNSTSAAGNLAIDAESASPDFGEFAPPRIHAEEYLRFAATVFDNSHNSIMITDADANIVAVNPAFSEMTGYEFADVLGKNPRMLRSGQQSSIFYQIMWKELLKNGRWQGELWNRHKNGKDYLKWLSISAVRNQDGHITHYIGISDDVTETRENANKINYLASFDLLTGLTNRSVATNRLEKEIAHAQYLSTRLAFLFLDLDNFKNVNESLGHAAGDIILRTVAQRLLDYVRDNGIVSRQGGDEFFVILPDIQDLETVNAMADEILSQIGKPFRIDGAEFFLSASIGIAIYPEDGADSDTLQKNAEMAMYSAKQAGRNTHRFFAEGMHALVLEKLLIRNGLLRALDKGEFVLHYQPQVCLVSGRMVGAEALLRWHQPDVGLVYPDNFIDIAEDSGLIIPIGKWVLHEACRQAVAWHRAGWTDLKIAVNISTLQFRRGDLERTVADALTESGLDPAFLELEMTESVLIQNTEKSLDTIDRLKRLGIKLSLDDFGTGFSSLGYLKRLPVDKLKIDRSFVSDIMTDKDDAAIVLSVISLAHTLNKKVVAEGVETQEQISFLQRHGCDEMQGYFYSKPLPSPDFTNLLQDRCATEPAEHLLK